MSKSFSSHSRVVARAVSSAVDLSLPAIFGEQLAALYDVVQRSQFAFGSPLGPFHTEKQSFHLPRFVYFGPRASEVSLRLAFIAGQDHRDLRSTLALLHLVEVLALNPDIGEGLHLSFFPAIDVLGLANLTENRALGAAHWGRSSAPEIKLLEQDARLSGYHGFVRLESSPGQDVATVRLRFAPTDHASPDVELISPEDFESDQVHWESAVENVHPTDGPLSVAEDLPVRPFELTLRLPSGWSAELYREATASILKHFILRYRGILAYGQHL